MGKDGERLTDVDDDWERIPPEGGPGDGEDRHLVCMPCYAMVPLNTGLLTIHDVPEDRKLRDVWCPWCGDLMEPADDLLTDEEREEYLLVE